MKKPYCPANWAEVRKRGRENYAFKYGVMLFGVPLLLIFLVFGMYQEGFYGFMGWMAASVPALVWYGRSYGLKQFDRYENAFMSSGEDL